MGSIPRARAKVEVSGGFQGGLEIVWRSTLGSLFDRFWIVLGTLWHHFAIALGVFGEGFWTHVLLDKEQLSE